MLSAFRSMFTISTPSIIQNIFSPFSYSYGLQHWVE
jgi:hypothetical protein